MPIQHVLFIYERIMKDNQLYRTGRGLISPQVFLAMKLTIFIFFFSILGVMGSAKAQRISISVKGVSLQKVLSEISKQSKHIVIYDEKDLKDSKPVTKHFNDRPMAEALDLVLEGQPVRYTIKGRSIVISKSSKETTEPAKKIPSVSEQQDAIRGRVTDSTGNALAGVTVQVKGTNIRTLTNTNGEYKFAKIDYDAVLVFSSIGFIPVELATSGRASFNISLNVTNSRIDEVEVNAGYWKVNDKLRTGNISKVEGAIIQQQPVMDPMLALAGRVPGLQVTQTSGLPGGYTAIRIRGTNSISNGNDPLFLIDGIPFTSNTMTNSVLGGGATTLSPFAMLNAQEIESIEVLKDADATAIYGSRGANGVILITTKKGKEGRTQFNVNAYTGAGKGTRKLDLLNTEQYLEMRREAFANDGISTYPASAYDVNGTWNTDRYTDWQEVLIGNTATISNFQLQVSGGSAQTQFNAGGGMMNETTIFPGDSKSSKVSSNLNINHRSSDKRFGILASVRYMKGTGNQPRADITLNQIFLPPNAPDIYKTDGELNWEDNTWYNPFANFLQRAKSTTRNVISNAVLDYQITRELQVKLNLGYSEQNMKQNLTTPIKSYNPSLWIYPAIRSHSQANYELKSWIVEPQLNYSKSISMGTLNATFGMTFQENKQDILAISANNFTDDALIDNIAAASNISISQNKQTQYKYAALFARINYDWKEKYVLNIVARRDGSSRFAPGRKYGTFASLGGAWIFTKESFLQNSVLSFGKIRASYGVTGNDQLSDYQYFNTYSSYNYPYLNIIGLFPTRLHSPDYGWEAVKKLETALDLGFFEDRVRLSTAFYRNRTSNQLVGYTLPTMTGFSSIQANLPAVVENRGWELELNTVNIKKTHFNWSSSLNISFPRNKLIAFPDFENSTYQNTYTLGRSLATRKLWHYIGVDPSTGIVQYEDVNGDGKITSPEDLQSRVDLSPKFLGGLSNTVTYANFNLDFHFQFIKKTGRILSSYPGTMNNQHNDVVDRWQNPDDITDVPLYSQNNPGYIALANGGSNSDIFYGDASFLRLKNLVLSYQLPKSLLKRIRASQCNIYLQGQNIFTITKYKGLDPETEAYLPPVRMFTAGINLSF
jgi:TonB-linked SusC/RagA family outer membrane protein